jgi:hypothetical protein
MKCEEFNPQEFAELLMLKADRGKRNRHRSAWRSLDTKAIYEAFPLKKGMGLVELRRERIEASMTLGALYLHYHSCPIDERAFQNYLSQSRYTLEELNIILDGLRTVARQMEIE